MKPSTNIHSTYTNIHSTYTTQNTKTRKTAKYPNAFIHLYIITSKVYVVYVV